MLGDKKATITKKGREKLNQQRLQCMQKRKGKKAINPKKQC